MAISEQSSKNSGTMVEIDRLIHEPARFNIMAHLYVIQSADFLFLQKQIGLTWGNLSSHLAKLEKAGYIEIEKDFIGKKPHTMLYLSNNGRTAFEDYHKRMKQVFKHLPA
ncbi:MAG: transcriptional regulator [Dehalococcoidales bacterium]|nr:transcriptional regulator [Dehalococcoidales bacterium]